MFLYIKFSLRVLDNLPLWIKATKLCRLSGENVAETTAQNCFPNAGISSNDQLLHRKWSNLSSLELWSSIVPKKKLNSAQIPNDLSPEGFTSLDDSVVATESALFDELPADMVINGDVVHLEMIARMIAQIQKYELKNEP